MKNQLFKSTWGAFMNNWAFFRRSGRYKVRNYWGVVWGYPKAILAEAALDSELINKPTRKEGHNYIIM